MSFEELILALALVGSDVLDRWFGEHRHGFKIVIVAAG